MPENYTVHPSNQINGKIFVPGDKSISHRSLILLSISEKRGAYKIKDFFVPNSYVFNRWIGAYSGLESCLGEYCLIISTNFKPQLVFFVCILCKNVLLDNLQKFHFHYKSVTYLGVSNHPLVFVQPPVMIIHVS